MIGGNEILPLAMVHQLRNLLRDGRHPDLMSLTDLAISELELRRRLGELIERAGQPGRCRGCDATVFWFVHMNGARCPYDVAGTSHFATCVKADDFRRAHK